MRPGGYNDTEEKMLNEVFRGRWKALNLCYNAQKRAFKYSPSIWNQMRHDGIRIVHFVGAKPWQSLEEMKRQDWEVELGGEASVKVYAPLFSLWRKVRNTTLSLSLSSMATCPEMLGIDVPIAFEV